MKLCSYCKREFNPLTSNQLYCSKECKSAEKRFNRYRDTKSVKIKSEPYKPRQRVAVETDEEQLAIRLSIAHKQAMPPSEVVTYGPEHPYFDSIVARITPVHLIPHRHVAKTYGAHIEWKK